MKVKKDVIIDLIILGIEQGKSPTKIAKENNISKQQLYYYMRRLREKGILEKRGYGVWERSKKSTKVANSVRGHAFMWKIKLFKKFNWIKILESKKIPYKKIYKGTPSILFKQRKIWLGKKNIIIYEPESFFGKTAVDTRKYAFSRLFEILDPLQAKLDINLKKDNLYTITVARHHYSLIKNCLAQQCNKTGQKIVVSNTNGMWFVVDNSYNLDEAETIHPKTALLDNVGIQRYFNEHKETNFKVTPSFLLESINKVTQNQVLFSKNFESHIKAIKDLSKGVKKLVKITEEVQKENKLLKQRRLSEWQ